jgi:hypothetical protein
MNLFSRLMGVRRRVFRSPLDVAKALGRSHGIVKHHFVGKSGELFGLRGKLKPADILGVVLFRIQRVFRACIELDSVDPTYRFAFIIIIQEDAFIHELAAGAATAALTVSTLVSGLQVDNQLPGFMVKVVSHIDFLSLEMVSTWRLSF